MPVCVSMHVTAWPRKHVKIKKSYLKYVARISNVISGSAHVLISIMKFRIVQSTSCQVFLQAVCLMTMTKSELALAMDRCAELLLEDRYYDSFYSCDHVDASVPLTRSKVEIDGCSECGGWVCRLCAVPRSHKACCKSKICQKCAKEKPRCGVCSGPLCGDDCGLVYWFCTCLFAHLCTECDERHWSRCQLCRGLVE